MKKNTLIIIFIKLYTGSHDIMKKRDIIIIFILTIILVIILIASLEKKQEIEDIYLSVNKDFAIEGIQSSEFYNFKSNASEIYLIIKVKNLTVDSEIKVKWFKAETGKDGDNYNLIQENTLTPVQKGSGKIVVLLVKRDNTYEKGEYYVEAYLNGNNKISKKFYIDS